MPKPWNKRYQWIVNHQAALEKNYKTLTEKMDEIEKQQQEDYTKIRDTVDQSKEKLSEQHETLNQGYQKILSAKTTIQNQINKQRDQYNKLTNKIRKAEDLSNADKNWIQTDYMNAENGIQIKEHLDNVVKELSNLQLIVNSQIEELEAKFDDKQQQWETDSIDDEINQLKSKLTEQNQRMKHTIHEQTEKCCKKALKTLSKKYKNSIDHWAEFTQEVKTWLKSIQSNHKDQENESSKEQFSIENEFDVRKSILKEVVKAAAEYNQLMLNLAEIESERELLIKVEVKNCSFL